MASHSIVTVARRPEHPTPTREDADYAFEIVKRICAEIGPGIPGSAQERKRADAFRDEIALHLGPDSVAVEEFTVAPRAWLGLWPISAVFLVAAALLNAVSGQLAGAASSAAAIAALVLAVASIAAIAMFVVGTELLDPLFAKKQSANVIGTLRRPGARDIKRLLIVSGHHDSAPENTWLALLGRGMIALSAIAVLGFLVTFVMCAIQVIGVSMRDVALTRFGTVGWLTLACAIVPAAVYGLFFNRGWQNGGTVPGAADNLAASALVAALSRFFAKNPACIPEDVEIRFISFGSEEAGLRGSRRYVDRHVDELRHLDAQLLNFEIIAQPKLAILTSDVNGTVKHSAEIVKSVAAAAERVGVPHEVKPASFGVGTDAAPFSKAGLQATTLLAFKVPEQMLAFYHQKSDRPEVLNQEALSNVLALAVEWITSGGFNVSSQREESSPFTQPDPAEHSWFNRLFYRNRRPTWLGHWVSQFFCWWCRVGLPPRGWFALRVRDRNSGRMRSDAIVVPTCAGQRYVVSMFGTISDWVQNLEARQGEAVIAHGGSEPVRLVSVPQEDRPPILQEYVRVASSGRKHFPLSVDAPLADFAAIAAQYPVYRIEARAN